MVLICQITPSVCQTTPALSDSGYSIILIAAVHLGFVWGKADGWKCLPSRSESSAPVTHGTASAWNTALQSSVQTALLLGLCMSWTLQDICHMSSTSRDRAETWWTLKTESQKYLEASAQAIQYRPFCLHVYKQINVSKGGLYHSQVHHSSQITHLLSRISHFTLELLGRPNKQFGDDQIQPTALDLCCSKSDRVIWKVHNNI